MKEVNSSLELIENELKNLSISLKNTISYAEIDKIHEKMDKLIEYKQSILKMSQEK